MKNGICKFLNLQLIQKTVSLLKNILALILSLLSKNCEDSSKRGNCLRGYKTKQFLWQIFHIIIHGYL